MGLVPHQGVKIYLDEDIYLVLDASICLAAPATQGAIQTLHGPTGLHPTPGFAGSQNTMGIYVCVFKSVPGQPEIADKSLIPDIVTAFPGIACCSFAADLLGLINR